MSEYTETHSVTLTKDSQRNLNDKAVRNNLTTILAGLNNRSRAASGWSVEANDPHFQSGPYIGDDHRNVATSKLRLVITYHRSDGRKPGSHDLLSLLRKVADICSRTANGSWTLESCDDTPYVPIEGSDAILSDNIDNIGYADCEIPDDFESNFAHLFGLSDHIGMIRSRLEAGIDSGWVNRFHTVLVGPPGCGKSDICGSLKRALGDDAVIEYDGTAMTSAGAIKDLTERDILPRVVVIEEIEKAPADCANFLLSVMDTRAEIRKTTARTNIQRQAKLYCIATVNNYELFQKAASGALASRFGRPIGFKRPSREMRAMILAREIDKVNGDQRWIEPTLDYCEGAGIDDPRLLISICLSGGDRLLTGEYQRMMDATALENTSEIADWSTMEESVG